MKYLKNFEDKNMEKSIRNNFGENSDEIVKIIDTYKEKSDVDNILQKISFILESPGDIETIENDGEIIAYYIDMKSKNKYTIIFDTELEEFKIDTFNNFKTKKRT